MKMKNKQGDFRNKHRTEWHDFLWSRFLEQFSDTKFRKSINALFSDYEKRLITKRLAALALIQEGMGAREIGRLLWLSRSTIGALKTSFFKGAYKSQRSLNRKRVHANAKIEIKQNFWFGDFLEDISFWEMIKNPPPPWYRKK